MPKAFSTVAPPLPPNTTILARHAIDKELVEVLKRVTVFSNCSALIVQRPFVFDLTGNAKEISEAQLWCAENIHGGYAFEGDPITSFGLLDCRVEFQHESDAVKFSLRWMGEE